MSWERRFCIGGIHVTVRDETDACHTDVDQITRLYPSADGDGADLFFEITTDGERLVLSERGRELWTSPDAREIVAAFEVHHYLRILESLPPGTLSLHASAVSTDGGAVLFAGESGAGKSSLCTAALLAGSRYLTDEFALLDSEGAIHPFPRPLQWAERDHPAFDRRAMVAGGLFTRGVYHFPDHQGAIISSHLWFPELVSADPLPLRGVVLAEYGADHPPAYLAEIRRGEGLMHLPQHLHTRRSAHEAIRLLNRHIPERTPFFRLQFSDVHTAWREVATRLDNPG